MKKVWIGICIGMLSYAYAQELKIPAPVTLPNGWKLTPIGKSLQLGDLPLNLAVSKNSKFIAVTNNGQSVQSIQLIDVKSQKIIDSNIIILNLIQKSS